MHAIRRLASVSQGGPPWLAPDPDRHDGPSARLRLLDGIEGTADADAQVAGAARLVACVGQLTQLATLSSGRTVPGIAGERSDAVSLHEEPLAGGRTDGFESGPRSPRGRPARAEWCPRTAGRESPQRCADLHRRRTADRERRRRQERGDFGHGCCESRPRSPDGCRARVDPRAGIQPSVSKRRDPSPVVRHRLRSAGLRAAAARHGAWPSRASGRIRGLLARVPGEHRPRRPGLAALGEQPCHGARDTEGRCGSPSHRCSALVPGVPALAGDRQRRGQLRLQGRLTARSRHARPLRGAAPLLQPRLPGAASGLQRPIAPPLRPGRAVGGEGVAPRLPSDPERGHRGLRDRLRSADPRARQRGVRRHDLAGARLLLGCVVSLHALSEARSGDPLAWHSRSRLLRSSA